MPLEHGLKGGPRVLGAAAGGRLLGRELGRVAAQNEPVHRSHQAEREGGFCWAFLVSSQHGPDDLALGELIGGPRKQLSVQRRAQPLTGVGLQA